MTREQALCRVVALSDDTWERIAALAQAADCEWGEMYRRVISAGLIAQEQDAAGVRRQEENQ